MNHKQYSTSGLNLLVRGGIKGYTQAQSAWRFYNNDNVDIYSLNNPILEKGLEAVNRECGKYLLVAHDWSLINYRNHKAKEDCIETKRSNTKKAMSRGYELQSSLAISDITGEPITPLVHNLKTKDKVFSTYEKHIDVKMKNLDELSHRIRYIDNEMRIDKQIVHIVDREGDSVGFFRKLQEQRALYIVRALDRVSIEYEGNNINQKELAKSIDLGKYVKSIEYRNKQVKIYVNSVDANITRDTYIRYTDTEGQIKCKR